MKLSDMRQSLSSRGIQLTKSLGQNFLHDQNQLDRIAELGELVPGDQVLEIGPGLGPLTAKLLERGAEVFAIEKDRRLCEFLRERFTGESRLKLIEDDALAYIKGSAKDWRNWKLLSNLPYSVASPTLVELAISPAPPERMVATLQLETRSPVLSLPVSVRAGRSTPAPASRWSIRKARLRRSAIRPISGCLCSAP